MELGSHKSDARRQRSKNLQYKSRGRGRGKGGKIKTSPLGTGEIENFEGQDGLPSLDESQDNNIGELSATVDKGGVPPKSVGADYGYLISTKLEEMQLTRPPFSITIAADGWEFTNHLIGRQGRDGKESLLWLDLKELGQSLEGVPVIDWLKNNCTEAAMLQDREVPKIASMAAHDSEWEWDIQPSQEQLIAIPDHSKESEISSSPRESLSPNVGSKESFPLPEVEAVDLLLDGLEVSAHSGEEMGSEKVLFQGSGGKGGRLGSSPLVGAIPEEKEKVASTNSAAMVLEQKSEDIDDDFDSWMDSIS